MMALLSSTSYAINPCDGILFKMINKTKDRSNLHLNFRAANYNLKNGELTFLGLKDKERMDSTVTEYDNNGEWDKMEKVHYVYNDKEQLTEQYDYISDDNYSSFLLDEKSEYFYNDDGILSRAVFYEPFDNDPENLQFEYQMDVTFNSYGHPATITISSLDEETGELAQTELIENEYDNEGNILKETYRMYLKEMETWLELYITEYNYENGLLISSYTSNFNEETFTLEPSYSEMYEYGEYDVLMLINEYYYDAESDSYVLSAATEFNFDENGNPLDELVYVMNYLTGELYESDLYEYDYDVDVSVNDLIMPMVIMLEPRYSEQIVNKPIENLEWVKIDDNWELGYRTQYFYSIAGSDVKDNKLNFSVYPNPAMNYIEVTLSDENLANNISEDVTVKIFNILGEEVLPEVLYTKLNSTSKRIDISYLPKGVYFIHIGDRIEKFVKK